MRALSRHGVVLPRKFDALIRFKVPRLGFHGLLLEAKSGGEKFGDTVYQLKKAEYPNVAPFNAEVDQWTYDAIGNRLTSQVNASILNYSYEKISPNPKNAQKLLGDGLNSYAYDFNGSQTSRTGGASYGFVNDLDNRLASITGAESATYTYDYQGRRSSKTVSGVTTKYLYDGLNLVSETTSGATTRYAFGPSIDEPLALYASGAVSYLNADGLGSIVATNSPTGTVSHSSVFDAWGLAKTETGTRTHPFTYTGREVGEAGLLFYRARLMQPATGRFGAEDRFPLGNVKSLYGYADGAPTLLKDPLGLYSVEDGTEDTLNFLAGFGDTLLLDIPVAVRKQLEYTSVDRCSKAYRDGQLASLLVGLGRLGYAGVMKGASLRFGLQAVANGASAEAVAQQASAARNEIKVAFRLGLFKNARVYTWQAIADMYQGDPMAIIAASGRTNNWLNAWGFGTAVSGALEPEECKCKNNVR